MALSRGVQPDEVERWEAAALPCAIRTATGQSWDGSAGPCCCPPDSPGRPPVRTWSRRWTWRRCPRPPPGCRCPVGGLLHLTARSCEEALDAGGEALHVPVGTPVEKHPLAPGHDPDDAWAELGGRTAEGEVLRLRRDVSLPGNESLYDPAEYPSARELRYAWAQGRDEAHPHHDGLRLQLGGYPVDPYGETDMLTASARQAARVSGQPVEEQSGPWEAPRAGKQVLLAQWYGGALVDGRVYWTAARRDLAAGRSGAVSVLGFFQGPG
ncbi:hypothetical protein [Streptomyces sp. EAG2]|uniref:hypothetical protein n=1 Tax=Streptomyces sp. EAG2 TaxID=2056495 RepID=UPI001675F5AB|nr:hypothetical protein [Streptomyces sp. EAG2]